MANLLILEPQLGPVHDTAPEPSEAASTVPSPPYEHFNIETGVDPFGVFRTVDYGDVVVSPGDVIESHTRMTNKVKEVPEILTVSL